MKFINLYSYIGIGLGLYWLDGLRLPSENLILDIIGILLFGIIILKVFKKEEIE